MSEVKFRELRNAPPMVINFAKAVMRATVKPGSNPTGNRPASERRGTG